jgi:hypothetical protein
MLLPPRTEPVPQRLITNQHSWLRLKGRKSTGKPSKHEITTAGTFIAVLNFWPTLQRRNKKLRKIGKTQKMGQTFYRQTMKMKYLLIARPKQTQIYMLHSLVLQLGVHQLRSSCFSLISVLLRKVASQLPQQCMPHSWITTHKCEYSKLFTLNSLIELTVRIFRQGDKY